MPPASPDPAVVPTPAQVSADQGWKLLSTVNEWIRFADAKAGAVLAFAGAMGTMLYNLVKGLPRTTGWLDTSVIATCVLLFACALLAGLTIAPRTTDKDAVPDTISRLFFASITQHYKGNRLAYRNEIRRLSEDTEALLVELADQIHANARIATVKTRRAGWAVRVALAAGALLAVVTIQVALL